VDGHVVDKAKSFADEHRKPRAEQWEQTRQQPEKALRMAISEFAAIRIPKKLGGSGSSAATIARVYEKLAKIDIGVTCALAVPNIVTIAVAFIENASLRDRYLGKLMSGEAIGAFLLTEPDIGRTQHPFKPWRLRKTINISSMEATPGLQMVTMQTY
jgi:alkylation response protein AidB-like acyl-CoA dehydrogenase